MIQHTKKIFNFLFYFLHNLLVSYYTSIVKLGRLISLRSIVLLDVALILNYYVSHVSLSSPLMFFWVFFVMFQLLPAAQKHSTFRNM